MKLTFELFKPGPKKKSKRDELIEQQNKIRELNALVSYEVVNEGEESNIFLSDVPGMSPSAELYRDAMEKLAQEMVEENMNVTRIRKIIPAIDMEKTSKIFDEMGFAIEKVDKYIAYLMSNGRYKENVVVAHIGAEKFLERFTRELAIE